LNKGIILLIFRHLKFRLTSFQAQRGACYGISIIDKHHFTFLLLHSFVSLIIKFFMSCNGFLEKVSYRISSARSPLRPVYVFPLTRYWIGVRYE